MDYEIDLDPKHSVIRLRIWAEIVTMELAKAIHARFTQFSSSGGPYAAIYDLTMVEDTTIPVEAVRGFARSNPAVPLERPQVVVGAEPATFGLARIFQMCREHVYGLFEVVHTMNEAYDIVGAHPEDFKRRIFPPKRRPYRGRNRAA